MSELLESLNLLDWLLLVLVLAYAVSGYWQGFITGAFATCGLLLGGLGGILLAPLLLGRSEPGLWVSLAALVIVVLAATTGQALLQWVGARVRAHVTWQPARAVDALGGSVLSSGAVLLVAWALGVAISGAGIAGLSPLVRESAVLGRVNQVLPAQASRVLDTFNDVVGATFFPRYLEPFENERIVPVPPGPQRIAADPDVRAVRPSVLKILGVNECGQGIEGSGFLYADDRLMTNAHVVAGVEHPTVVIGDERVSATVVYYNPDIDIAVLALDDQGRPHLSFDREVDRGTGVAVVGYPEGGPYDVQPGRIRTEQRLRSSDIYGEGSVVREVYSLRAQIRPGNSGGPVVTSSGEVAGVVFAASVTDPRTGYALTAEQVASAATKGIRSSGPVDTGGCAA